MGDEIHEINGIKFMGRNPDDMANLLVNVSLLRLLFKMCRNIASVNQVINILLWKSNSSKHRQWPGMNTELSGVFSAYLHFDPSYGIINSRVVTLK